MGAAGQADQGERDGHGPGQHLDGFGREHGALAGVIAGFLGSRSIVVAPGRSGWVGERVNPQLR